MNKPELSIIIPFASEYPAVLFTVQSIAITLIGKIDFEIIVVDNDCPELQQQWKVAREKTAAQLTSIARKNNFITESDIDQEVETLRCMTGRDKSSQALKASAGGNPWLRYMKFDKYLSHWECKRLACQKAKADTFLFIDAHCVPSNGIAEMFDAYNNRYRNISSFHMPLTYKILEWHRLIYKMVVEDHFYRYSFTSFPGVQDCGDVPVEVPCMSTCGMMISREVYDRVGGWPKNMGAYGGGENFMNYALAVTGHKKYIYPSVTLHHHGEKRDYHSTYDGTLFNRLLGHYLFGGQEALENLAGVSKGNSDVLKAMVDDILSTIDYVNHRQIIKENTVVPLADWCADWDH